MSKKDVLARLAAHVNRIHRLVKDAAARDEIDALEILDAHLVQALVLAEADIYSVSSR